MKGDWDRLGKEYKSSASTLIVDVDCTKHQEVCSDHGVSGYPTIKYYVNGEEKDYQGGRSYDALATFTKDNLAKSCDVASGDDCGEREKKYIEKMKKKGADAVKKQLTRLDGMKGKSMKPELKVWMFQRIAILKQLDGGKSEL